jgi:hypothetical protein
MSRAARWAAGLAASAMVHVAGAGVLLAALTPDPVPVQPAPTARLDMRALAVERAAAQQAEPRSGAARESDAAGAAIAAGAISASRAQASAPAPLRAAAAAPDPRPIATAPLLATALAGARPTSVAMAPSPAPGTSVAIALPRTQTAAAAPPPLDRAAPLDPLAQPAAPSSPDTTPLAAALPAPAAAEAAAPQGTRVTARLAFAGSDGDVDPVSLAAFQSFMQPGEAAAQGDPLRDGVAALLAAVPCSRLQVSFDPETTTLQLKGHIPEAGLRGPVLAALRAQMGSDIAVSDSLRLLPRPQCGALSGIASVGLPQSTDQTTNPLLIGEDTHARALDFVRDDRMWFDITAPDYPAYVYVDFFDAGGNVIHLAPNSQVPLAALAPKTAYRVGARHEGDAGLTLLVGPPYGQEIAVAFAASAPLYDGLRPMIEPAAPYLDWLRGRVADARAADPQFKGEWVYFFVGTSES